MQPTPLVLQGDYEGEYLRIDRSSADTEPKKVKLPADLAFLAKKR
jgi:hypothetical protein